MLLFPESFTTAASHQMTELVPIVLLKLPIISSAESYIAEYSYYFIICQDHCLPLNSTERIFLLNLLLKKIRIQTKFSLTILQTTRQNSIFLVLLATLPFIVSVTNLEFIV